MEGRELMLGPLTVHATFTFPRPKAHYRTGKNASLLRDDAPEYHTSAPDLDKLQRALGDAMTGVVYRDDKQIAQWAVVKVYGAPAGVHIAVTSASPREGSTDELQDPPGPVPPADA